MKIATTLTCDQLYQTDPTFASAIAKWVADRRCPVQLADYLRESGLDTAAECADWCASEPDRPMYGMYENYSSGPYPGTGFKSRPFYWCRKANGRLFHANEVPGNRIPVHSHGTENPVPLILWLLDHWIPESPSHDLYTDSDIDAPQCIRDSNGQVVLGLCKRCGRGESEMSEPCKVRKE